MLTEICVHNYRCLVNFEYRPEKIQLLLGRNGTGKSSVMDVLHGLQHLVVRGAKVGEVFPSTSLTKWYPSNVQDFAIRVRPDSAAGVYHYKLQVEHNLESGLSRVKQERLERDGRPLYESLLGEVQLYRDDFSPGPQFKFDWTLSGVGVLDERRDNRSLTAFRNWLARMLLVRPNPFAMSHVSDAENSRLDLEAKNFASWYRGLVLDRAEIVEPLRASLVEVLGDFENLRLQKYAENVRVLEAVFRREGERPPTCQLPFSALSHGQRTLILLYTILQYLSRVECSMVCIDEPDNFVALRELQPWLTSMQQCVEERAVQTLLISHHPEFINQLVPNSSVRFSRDDSGAARIGAFSAPEMGILTPAEIVAHGWEDGE